MAKVKFIKHHTSGIAKGSVLEMERAAALRLEKQGFVEKAGDKADIKHEIWKKEALDNADEKTFAEKGKKIKFGKSNKED